MDKERITNQYGYHFEIYYDEEEQWVHIDDPHCMSCGDLFIPDKAILDLLIENYGKES